MGRRYLGTAAAAPAHLTTLADIAQVAARPGAGTAGDDLGTNLVKVGQLLTSTAGSFDASIIESPWVGRDPLSGRWAMTYVGYTNASGNLVASAGLAYSSDKVTWIKTGSPILQASGVDGSPDKTGISGPVWYYENGLYHLYYIGLDGIGYEAGNKTICYATATNLAGPWTRKGAAVTTAGTGWRGSAVWRANIVKRASTYYMFFNATAQGTGVESIGYATSASIGGPWSVDDANSPIVPGGPSGAWDERIAGDPSVRRVGDMWVMDYYGYAANDKSYDGVAVTTDAAFPLGWVKHPANPLLSPTAGTYDGLYASKPCTLVAGGQVLHYYTAVAPGNVRSIALAVSASVGSGTGSGGSSAVRITAANTTNTPSLWVTEKSGASNSSTVAIGDDIKVATQSGRTRLQLGNSIGSSEFLVGQASDKCLLFNWTYNATPNAAVANLETYGGSNLINIQNNSGQLRIAGSGGQVGFYGGSPVGKPTVTGSRSDGTALASLLTALANLGLITNNTTA